MDVVTWDTHDLALASYLGLKLETTPTIEWTSTGTAKFLFEDGGFLQECLDRYVSGRAVVEPREYFFKSHELRKLMNESRPQRKVRQR